MELSNKVFKMINPLKRAAVFVLFTLCMADFASAQNLIGEFRGHSDWITAVYCDAAGRTFAAGIDTSKRENNIKVWDIASEEVLKTFSGYSTGLSTLQFADAGKTLITGTKDHALAMYDIASGTLKQTFSGHKDWIKSVAVSHAEHVIATGSWDTKIKIWDVETGKEIKTISGHKYPIDNLVFTPDGRYLISGNTEESMKIWDLETGNEMPALPGDPFSVRSIAVSPNGKWAAFGTDNDIKIWNFETKALVGHKINAHRGYIDRMVFSPDSRLLVSAGWDNKIKLWNVETCELVQEMYKATSDILSLHFSDDGHFITAGFGDNTVKLWSTEGLNINIQAPTVEIINHKVYDFSGGAFICFNSEFINVVFSVKDDKEVKGLVVNNNKIKSGSDGLFYAKIRLNAKKQIEAVAIDSDGIKTRKLYSVVEREHDGPVINPLESQFVSENVAATVLEITDQAGVKEVIINGTKIEKDGDGLYRHTMPLRPGQQIQVFAMDHLDNQKVRRYTVNDAGLPVPKIDMVSYADGKVSIKVDDNSGIRELYVNINNKTYKIAIEKTADFAQTYDLFKGPNRVSVSAVNNFGKQKVEKRSIFIKPD